VTISREELENKLKDFEKFNPNMDLTTLNKKKMVNNAHFVVSGAK
jgi:hypothetical protein